MRALTREWLTSLKRRALRKKAWYRVLKRVERGVVDLTIRCVERVRSQRLALVLGRIICKVLAACRSMFLRGVEEAGRKLAEKLGGIAVAWGLQEASEWRRDAGFIRHLGVNAVNDLPGWSHG